MPSWRTIERELCEFFRIDGRKPYVRNGSYNPNLGGEWFVDDINLSAIARHLEHLYEPEADRVPIGSGVVIQTGKDAL
jgi:hypothetical protein